MSDPEPPVKLNNQQVGRVGKHYVAAELHRRGASTVTFWGNMRENNILASDGRTRTVRSRSRPRQRAPGRRR